MAKLRIIVLVILGILVITPQQLQYDQHQSIQLPQPNTVNSLFLGNQPINWNDMLRDDDIHIIMDIGDLIFLIPELIFDGLILLSDNLFPDIDTSDDSITEKLFNIHYQSSRNHLFSIFLSNLMKREQRFFSRFNDSYLNTPGFSDNREEIDMDNLVSEQRKVLWDTLKNTYLSKYRLKIDDRIRDEAFYFSEWRGIDFVVLPPLMTGYLLYRGLDKNVNIGGLETHIYLDPIYDFIREDNILAGIGIELAPKDWPLKLIMSAGLDEGDYELQFIGIGTSFGSAKSAILLKQDQK